MTSSFRPSEAAVVQFFKFGAVGVVGFLVDTAGLYLLLAITDLGLYGSRAMSFLPAVTASWWLNRRFTFGYDSTSSRFRQWLRFVAANAAATAVNYGVYVGLLVTNEALRDVPVIAVAAGSIAGLAINFTVSRRYVFRNA